MYTTRMRYEWNPEKNELLKKKRRISFEQVVFHLSKGDLWKVSEHPDKDNYPEQKIFFVIVDGYIYLVPYVVGKEITFLKTIIPSRKATKAYKKEKKER